jgi:hypothetical protein
MTMGGTKKAHDWSVDQIVDLFHTTHTVKAQHVTKNRGRHGGDVELTVYRVNVEGPVPLVMDLLISHDRFGSSSVSKVTLTLILMDTYITLMIWINHSMRLPLTRSDSIELTTIITHRWLSNLSLLLQVRLGG